MSRSATIADGYEGVGESIRVLHVDDEPGLAELVAEFLTRQNERFDITTETHPSDALDRLEEAEFDCIVTDYDMPDIDGIELIETVRAQYGDLPCIIYTGKGSEDVASDAIAAGATDYLQKQNGDEQYELLANRIENAVESYRAERRADTLERIRSVVREVNQTLVHAGDRDRIERRVCEILADAETYSAAWIGQTVDDCQVIEPRAWAGIDDEYFEKFTLTVADEPAGQGPAPTALREDRLAVTDNVPATFGEEQFRDVAIEHDVRAIAAIPLTYEDAHYGVFVVLSDRTGTFDDTERDLLSGLGGDIAHAIDAVETRSALQAERDRRAALFENAPNPIAEVRFDDGEPVLESVNGAFGETFGCCEDCEGHPLQAITVTPEDGADHADLVRQLVDGTPLETEVRLGTTDGVRDFLLTGSPGREAGTDYVWYVDITERKSLETELQKKANLLDHIFGQIPTALYVKDREGRHIRLSDYDTDPADALGKTDPEIYGDTEFARQAYRDDMRVIETGEPIINKEEYNPGNDEWMLTSKVPWRDEDGDIQGLIGVSRIITEKKEYERQLERADRHLATVAAVLGGQLYDPLDDAMQTLADLRQGIEDERLEDAAAALDRMDALLHDILTLARQGDRVGDADLQQVDLTDTTWSVWSTVDTNGATLETDAAPDIEADPDRLRDLLSNLVDNAVEHGDGDVTVSVGRIDGEGFYVADDGPGIDAHDAVTVFEPGYTTDDSGTGFGLAIVSAIADAHGWEVGVTESEAGGTRVEIAGVDLV